jgi:hypothetical protein
MARLEPLSVKVAASTLVPANVRRCHCRGGATQPSFRLTVRMQAGDHPFSVLFRPLPRPAVRAFAAVWNRSLPAVDQRVVDRPPRRLCQGRCECQ